MGPMYIETPYLQSRHIINIYDANVFPCSDSILPIVGEDNGFHTFSQGY